ncbi:MAG TPA: cell division protein CrgA [Ilumatobacteraceae bacterium]|nr:cell division protein CrgA [Ilumatobacteraceae bacterium]
MAPPKRKTSGRVTPKGTRPGQVTTTHEPVATSTAGVSASSRYTPPTPKEFYESPRWVPILMLTLLAIGVLAILSRYVIWDTTNTPVLVGLAFLLAGLWVATKWR